MSLFYMCAMHDQVSYDPSDKCGLYMPGKLWDRKGAEPISTRVWYCGIERSEWEKEVQKRFLPEAGGASRASGDYDLELALNSAPGKIGCGCRFRPYSVGSSMVLEVIDRSVNDVITMYAIRAAIPPGPLSDEIRKVQKGWISAGRRANAKDLYGSIPVIYPKIHVIPGLPIPAIGRFPIRQAIKEEWPEIREENWYMMGLAIASTDRVNLAKVFYLCNKKLAIDPAVPMNYAAQHILPFPCLHGTWPHLRHAVRLDRHRSVRRVDELARWRRVRRRRRRRVARWPNRPLGLHWAADVLRGVVNRYG